jgi:hypothetical protein
MAALVLSCWKGDDLSGGHTCRMADITRWPSHTGKVTYFVDPPHQKLDVDRCSRDPERFPAFSGPSSMPKGSLQNTDSER